MTASLPWGHGDAYTLAIAVPVFVIGCVIHRKPLMANRAGVANSDLLIGLMGSAITIGPLAMILADPAVKLLTTWDIDLLDMVVKEARVTLWLAAFIALLNTTLAFVRAR
jgi:hypothetical protein